MESSEKEEVKSPNAIAELCELASEISQPQKKKNYESQLSSDMLIALKDAEIKKIS